METSINSLWNSDAENENDHRSQEQKASNKNALREELAYWAIKNGITISSLTQLLKILAPKIGIPLPIDGRTILQTPAKKVSIREMDDGFFFYFGVEKSLKKLIAAKRVVNSDIILDFNVDGVSISKSNNQALWPILCKVEGVVFVVALYLGKSKPNSSKHFFRDFVTECNKLITENLVFENKMYTFKVRNFIADAPAKSFALNIKGHAGYNSCLRCDVKGHHLKKRTTFYVNSSRLNTLKIRNKKLFRKRKYDKLQNGSTPLSKLKGFDPIFNTPYDYLHLICLGVMKTLIHFWIGAKKKRFAHSLNYIEIIKVSKRLSTYRKFCPREFQRRTRSLDEVAYWKAVEFRMVILYVGIVAFQGILHTRAYRHFLLLNFAMRCYSVDQYLNYSDEAKTALEKFVRLYSKLYGRESISHNIHALLHVPADVRLHGPVDNFSAFVFESYMKVLKEMVRTGPNALQQLVNRITEGEQLLKPLTSSCTMQTLGRERKSMAKDASTFPFPINIPQNEYTSYKSVKIEDSFISACRFCDGVIFLDTREIMVVENIIKHKISNQLFLVGRQFQSIKEYYSFPHSSIEVGVFKVSNLSTELFIHPIIAFAKKAFMLPTDTASTYAAMEMLHCPSLPSRQ
ncbi:uncharacterized protein LOC135848023 [Planococcus citri]|uniref:uncharacterized protein LOC135848023 n=1 Tax=Planococcus citri TaxID=170843 RepID=UPI0031FA3787